jgi:acyl-CoA synthetase (AMP-forming)/AMP-acid ligase II
MRLHDFLDYHAREQPDVEFAVEGHRSLTYRGAAQAVNRLANALIAAGLAGGDRVAILSKNTIEYALLYYAASKAGVIVVPLNYRLAAPELSYIVNDADSRMVFASDEYVPVVDGIHDELATVKRRVSLGAQTGGGWESYQAFVAGQPATAPDRSISLDGDVYQMYTSGTTGRPKGAVLTHRALATNLQQAAFSVGPAVRTEPGERYLIVAPLYHAAAAVTAFFAVYAGGSLYVMSDFVPADVVRALSEERIAMATLVPAMIQACLVMVADVAERRYPALRLISYGASPIAEQTLRRALEVFGCEFAQGYGMTEVTAVATYLLPSDHRRAMSEKPGLLLSAGRPIVGTEIRIVDDSDRDVPRGVVGEIIVRGGQLMRGYWRQEEATKEALRGGWMHTGDAGVMDEEGYIYIQDRVKDMIVSGGENVYPREIEDVLFQHPAIADAAVIGVPDDRFGEAVKAVVVLREGSSASEAEIMEFCRDKLGGYKRPRSVDFMDTLPRNPTGKVLKRALREKYWAGRQRRVG